MRKFTIIQIVGFSILTFLILATSATLLLSKKKITIKNKAAETNQSSLSPTPEFAKGEILVKFKNPITQIKTKNNVDVTSELDKKPVSFDSLSESSLPPPLKDINSKYKIRSIEKVFKGIKDPQTELNRLKSKFSREISNGRKKINEKEFLNTDLSKTYKLSFDQNTTINNVINQLVRNADIESVELNYIYKVRLVPNDPYYLDSYPNNITNRDSKWNPPYDYQWNLKKISMGQAWDISTGLKDTTVAVIDTGVDYTHPELGGCTIFQVNNNQCSFVAPGYDAVNQDDDPIDDAGHGTHVAGIIASLTNNSLGVAGMNFNLKIMPLKGLSSQGIGFADDLAFLIYQAANNGADIINMSWGGVGKSETIGEALKAAYALDIVLVDAAGNSNQDAESFYPASDRSTITVAATDVDDRRSSYSNYGGVVDVAAPGNEIISLRAAGTDLYCVYGDCDTHTIHSQFYRMSGTSMAAPHVTGLAALIKSVHPSFSNEEIRQVIRSGVDTINPDKYIGTGRINAYKAIQIVSIPVAKISSPYLTNIYKMIDIKGTASGRNFTKYVLEVGSGRYPINWTKIYESTTAIDNGNLLANWDSKSVNDGIISIRLSVYDSKGTIAEDRSTVVVTNKIIQKSVSGWPIKTADVVLPFTSAFSPSPIIANLDGGSDNEVIVSMLNGKIYAFKYSGKLVEGWPVDVGSVIFSSPAVADLNSDGLNEVVVTTESGFIYVFNNKGKIIPGWPVRITESNARIYNSPTLVDIDNDGDLEIVTGQEDAGLYVFHYDGKLMPGWPVGTVGSGELIYAGYATSATTDIDNDTQKEIIAATTWGQIWSMEKNGTSTPGWPLYKFPNTDIVLIDAIYSSPAIGDIDKDGVKDIVFGNDGFSLCLERNSNNDCIKAKTYDGGVFSIDTHRNLKRGWPVAIENANDHFANVISSPALGNLDNDKELEIVIGSWNNKIYAFNHDGSLLSGAWPVDTGNSIHASPIIGDIDSDGKNEIVIGSSDGLIYGIESDGTPVQDWPFITASAIITNESQRGIKSTAAIGDLNNDGVSEIVVVDNLGTIYLINTNSSLRSEWPMFNHDPYHSGEYQELPSISPTITSTPTRTPTQTPTNTPTPTRKPSPTPFVEPTLTFTPTPSPTPTPGIQNGGFEIDTILPIGIPDGWNGIRLTTVNDILVDNPHTGNKSFRMTSLTTGSASKILDQTIANYLVKSGTTFTLSGWNKLPTTLTSGKVKLYVFANNMDGTKSSYPLLFNTNLHDWQKREKCFKLGKDTNQLKVRIKYTGVGSRAFFDDVKFVSPSTSTVCSPPTAPEADD